MTRIVLGAWRRWTAAVLALALIVVSPGPRAYAAVGRVIEGWGPQAVSLPVAPLSHAAVKQGAAEAAGLAAPLDAAALPPSALSAGPEAAQAAAPGFEVSADAGAATPQSAHAPDSTSAFDAASRSLESAGEGVADTGAMRHAVDGARAIFQERPGESVLEAAGEPKPAGDAGRLEPSRTDAPKRAVEPPASEPGKTQPPRGPFGGWFGLGATAALFIGALIVQQVGVESQAAAFPALLQKIFGDFSIVADLTVVAQISGLIGRTIGPIIVSKFSLKTAYTGALWIKVGIYGAMSGMLAVGYMTVPLLAGIYLVSGFVGGVAGFAEKAIAPALIGQDQEKLEKFGALKQTLLETVGSLLPIATGFVVGSLGFMPVLVAFPVAFLLSVLMMAKWLKVPQHVEELRQKSLREEALLAEKRAAAGEKKAGVFAEFWSRIRRGYQVTRNDPALWYTFLAYVAYGILNPFLYNVMAPAYGVRLLGKDNPAVTSIIGNITGLYSLGGLLGGLVMLAEGRTLKNLPEEQVQRKLRTSMIRWMIFGTVGLAAIATMAPHMAPLWGAFTLPALALIPYGIAQVISNIKQENYFTSRAPAADLNDAIGFLGSATMAINTIGILGMKFLFTGKLLFGYQPFAFAGLAGFTPFVWIAWAMIPTAALYLLLTWGLSKASAAPKPAR